MEVVISEFGSYLRHREKVFEVNLLFQTDFISEFIYSYSVPMFYLFFFFSFIFLHYIMICSVKVKPDLSKQDMFFNSETTQLLQLRRDLL